LISTLATTTPATRSDTPTRRTVEAVAAPATTIAITTGASLGHAHETAITMTHLRSDAGLEKTGKGQTDTDRMAITIPAGPTEIATIETAIREVPDAFSRHVHLPRGRDREPVHDRDREYTLRGSESRTLATVGAFRVVSSRDLRDHDGSPADPRSGDLRHLREQGLIETTRVPGYRDHAVSLTKDGRSLLESHRDPDHKHSQTFYAGLGRERELEHDLQVYRACEQAEGRLLERGAHIDRVVLDHELKSEYQRWLHERDKDRDDYDGHPDRTPDEIREWAHDHDLPYFDDEVHFPDGRIEYQEPDGRWEREDIEVLTPHYRGAHGASVARSGFSCYRGFSLSVSGRSGGAKGRGRHGGLAEELWR
jgi:hypothetical protein